MIIPLSLVECHLHPIESTMDPDDVTKECSVNGESTAWEIEPIVDALRAVRTQSLNSRNRFDNPTVLPSKKRIEAIIESFSAAMFPHRLSQRQLQRECVDFFVGQQLDSACTSLAEQIRVELEYSDEATHHSGNFSEESNLRTKAILQQLPTIRELLDSDIQATYLLDPAARSQDEVLACYPGILALIHYRIAHAIYLANLPLIARMITEIAHSKTGIDIHPGAHIDRSFFIDHGTGVVIGETTIIGQNVRIHHGVTLGGSSNYTTASAAFGEKQWKVPRHPIVHDNVTIFADATILGRVRIGEGAIIGSNVCVTDDVPAFSRVMQAQSTLNSVIEGAGI
jgi:serine O-acetyltransferase